MNIVAEIKARRITGGAIVRVKRNGYEHSYRVSLRRYNRLTDTLVAHLGAVSNNGTRNGFETRLLAVDGLRESRQWAARHGRPRAKHWQPIPLCAVRIV